MTDTSKLDVLAVKHWRKKAKGEVGENLKLFLGVSPYGTQNDHLLCPFSASAHVSGTAAPASRLTKGSSRWLKHLPHWHAYEKLG